MAFNKKNKLGNTGKNYSNRSMTPRHKLLSDNEMEGLKGKVPKWESINPSKLICDSVWDKIPHGKYNGKSFIVAAVLDPEYILTCLEHEHFKITNELRKEIYAEASNALKRRVL